MVKPTCTQSASTSSPSKRVSDTISSCSSNSGSSKYKGVRKRSWGKWVSEIRLPNSRERIWLGSYDSAEKAARAFDAALYCLRGPEAKFNFPQNPPHIVGGRSLSPQEIQEVAARFANETTPGNHHNNNDAIDDNSSNNNNNVGTDHTEEYYMSCSSLSVSDGVATRQAESQELMDWSSFLSMLDTKQGISNYCFYSGLNQYLPGDQLYPLPNIDDDHNVDDDQNGGDGFSQSSYLWNF
ncbi:hypothetical protein PTKIN_Ptkin19aG0096200 [Pterospermum kingtungense]